MLMETKIPFTELVSVCLKLRIGTEVGDNVEQQAPAFQHNTASNSDIMSAFEQQVRVLRGTLQDYLERRADRRENWKG